MISGAAVAGGGTMRVRYQQGYLRLGHRKNGSDCWEFLWWDSEPTGKRVRRKAAIGTILEYPNEVQIFTVSLNGANILSTPIQSGGVQ